MAKKLNETGQPRSRIGSLDWGSMEWLLEDSIVPGVGMSVAVMTLKGGETSPLHRHPNCHELIYLVEGRVELTLDGEKIILDQGDSALSPQGTAHGLKNLGKGDAKMIVTYSEGRRIYENLERDGS